LKKANEEQERPTLIIGHTIMAHGAVKADGGSLEGAVSTHGQPLSAAGADIDATIRNLGGNPENPWEIRPEVAELYAERAAELREIADRRKAEFKAWAEANTEKAAMLADYENLTLPELNWNEIPLKPGMASRAASAAVLGYLAEHVGNMIVSSADLANSDKTDGFLKKTHALMKGDFSGAFLQAGVAELTMACIMNGIALHGGVFCGCATFFVFSDYMKPAIRIAALQEIPVKFIYSHDSFRVGEDGPTHEPIEQEAQLRLMEQVHNLSGSRSLMVIRPADSAETVAAYKMAMENKETPTALILSRQNLEDLPGENRREEAMKAVNGGYVVVKAENPDVVLVGNGSDVALLVHAAEELAKEGIKAQVASVPAIGVFLDQPQEYRESVIPTGVKKFGLTSGLPINLYPLMSGDFEVVGMERFGASAPAKVLEEHFGYTPAAVTARIRTFLSR
jgi:transketolase